MEKSWDASDGLSQLFSLPWSNLSLGGREFQRSSPEAVWISRIATALPVQAASSTFTSAARSANSGN